VDDHPLLQEGIAAMIRTQRTWNWWARARTGRDALPRFRETRPDVTLMDLRLPDMNGIEAVTAIRAEFPAARIVVLTTFEGDAEIQRALEAGARGYLLKSTPPRSCWRRSGRSTLGRSASLQKMIRFGTTRLISVLEAEKLASVSRPPIREPGPAMA
jgi:DNA-binding NarL/FixJ family response regulator